MDELLGVFDKQLCEYMQFEIMCLVYDLGIIIVYVIYDQIEVLIMLDWVVVFNDGCIQQLVLLDELYEVLQNLFVVQFIGENNVFEGVVIEIKGDLCKVQLDSGEIIDVVVVNVVKVGDCICVLICFECVEFCKDCL